MYKKLCFVAVFSNCFNFVSGAGGDGSVIGIIVGIIIAVLIIIGVFVLAYCCYLKKKRIKESHNNRNEASISPPLSSNRSVTYYNPNNYVQSINHNQTPHTYNDNYINDPSPRVQQTNRRNHNQNFSNQQLPLQPPPYSALTRDDRNNIQYTTTSGQPPIRESLGYDNPAFFNRSISSFAEYPSMTDILLTSSKTSLPAAVMLENSGTRQFNKFSDSAQGDSIESKTSKEIKHVYDNPRFSLTPEPNKKPIKITIGNKDVLNESFETYSDSDSGEVHFNPTSEKWLDPNRKKSHVGSKNIEEHYRPSKSHHSKKQRTTTRKPNSYKDQKTVPENADRIRNECKQSVKKEYKDTIEQTASPPETPKIIKQSNRTKKSKKKSDSSDSGAEVTIGEISMNPSGKGSNNNALKNKTFENRHSKISSDSGVEESSSTTISDLKPLRLKNGTKLKWVVVEEADVPPTTLNRSLSTEV